MDISQSLVTSECQSLDEQVSRVVRETPSYQLPGGEVVYLREELWIKPLVEVSKCEFGKDMFGLIWKPEEAAGWTEIDGVYILDEYIEETIAESANDRIWGSMNMARVRNMTSETIPAGTLVISDQVFRVTTNWEWRPLLPGELDVMNVYPVIAVWATRAADNDFWAPSLPDEADDFPEAVCPICGETMCHHYDDHKPLFKSCPTI